MEICGNNYDTIEKPIELQSAIAPPATIIKDVPTIQIQSFEGFRKKTIIFDSFEIVPFSLKIAGAEKRSEKQIPKKKKLKTLSTGTTILYRK